MQSLPSYTECNAAHRLCGLLYNVVLNRSSGTSLGNQYGPGEGVIWMDNTQCTGSETSLADCQHNGLASHNCGHSEDVSISCPTGKNNWCLVSVFNQRVVVAMVVATLAF